MKLLRFIFINLIFINNSYCQNVAINFDGSNPHPSAGLDIKFNDKGLLLPRLTSLQRNNIVNPAVGLMIYNIDSDCAEMYFGTNMWKALNCGCTAPPPNITTMIGTTRVCPNTSNVSFSVNPLVGASSYHWTTNNGNQIISGQGTNAITINFSSNIGTHTITVQASNSCGSTNTYQHQITVDNYNSAFTPLQGLTNSAVQFTPNNNYNNATYNWTFDQGSITSSTANSPSVTWTSPGTYDVSLSISDSYGCTSTTNQQVSITSCSPFTANFNNCTKTGGDGPTQAQCNASYSGTYLNGKITVTSGIQSFTIPKTDIYKIRVAGAQGGNVGGSGAIMEGEMQLNQGQVIKVLVGQKGLFRTGNTYHGGGGGGGTYVTLSDNTPLIIAGGGGGRTTTTSYVLEGSDTTMNGNTTTTGGHTYNNGGGTNGSGGQYGITNGPASGGGGLLTNGGNGDSGSTAGKAFVNGGQGGGWSGNLTGGFGGGGGGFQDNYHRSGGGGGYSGGQGGTWTGQKCGGGGASFLYATMTNISTSNGNYNNSTNHNGSIGNLNSFNAGDGFVLLTSTCQM